MLLSGKNALIFAATGAIGSGAARKFAQEGATVWLSGRNAAALQTLVAEIEAEGGKAHAHTVDATDTNAIETYVAKVAQASTIDIVFNAIGGRPQSLGYPQPSTSTSLTDFMIPLNIVLASQFLTARIAGAQMQKQGTSGAIVILSSTLSGMTAPFMAGISAASGAVEALMRSLAGEFGMAGIRVNCVRGSGMPETRTIQETVAGQIELTGQAPKMSLPPIGRSITVAETVAAAAFLASEQSGGMTGQVVTVCGGVFVG